MASQRSRHLASLSHRRSPPQDLRWARRGDFGGRWNSPGRRVIYAAESYAGAMLEVLVNANIGRMPKHHGWIEILIGET